MKLLAITENETTSRSSSSSPFSTPLSRFFANHPSPPRLPHLIHIHIANGCISFQSHFNSTALNKQMRCFVFLLAASVVSRSVDDKRDLRMVHVVMRHSIRAPVTLYPTDPHAQHAFGPNGRGQITMPGIRRAFAVGEMLRTRYDRFLGAAYNVSEFYAQSTGVERAQATLMTVNAGLWHPPDKLQQFDAHLMWFPVPVFMQPLEQDTLLLVAKDCPQYNLELQRVESSAEVQGRLKLLSAMMKDIEDKSGQKMRSFDDIGDIYATLLAEEHYGLELPEWTQPHFQQMATAAAYSFVVRAANERLQRFKGGVLLKHLISEWRAKVAQRSARKMILYGGHDSTIANLLSALKVFQPQVPDYAMAILLELSYDHALKVYGVEVFTKNSTAPLQQLQIPGCAVFCPLTDLVRLSENVVPVDWDAECATDDEDYTPPPFHGP